jgi:SAM-dependent methyltransferase
MLPVTAKTDYAPLAKSYAQHRKPHPELLARLASKLTPDSRVLELGCGTGNYITALRAQVGCECVGVDPSREMLEQLRARGGDVTTLQNPAERLELASERFDLVYSVDVIHHIQDRRRAFDEAFRVLREGGRIVTVTDSEWIIRHREILAVYFPETVEVELARYPRMERLHEEMLGAGFVDLHEEMVEHAYELTDATAFREKVFSSLLYLNEEAFSRGLAKLETDLARGPVRYTSRYALLWGEQPAEG